MKVETILARSPTHHPIVPGLATRYLMPGRARTFALTQQSIIDKRPAYDVLCSYMRTLASELKPGDALRVLDVGCGVPFFLNVLLTEPWAASLRLEYVGIDISREMIELFDSYLAPSRSCRLELTLHSGINLPIEGLERALPLASTPPFDAIIALQFSHYFPTQHGSPLWCTYQEAGITPLTKAEFWASCRGRLKPWGIYADFDDSQHPDPNAHERASQQWDEYGLRRLTDPIYLASLRAKDEPLFRQITQLYLLGVTKEEALKRYREARQMRRRHDYEEVAIDSFIQDELQRTFSHVERHTHPELSNFHLWVATP